MKDLNTKNGNFFFSRGAMKFFNSRIETTSIDVGGKGYFITSEQFDDKKPRGYTVRSIDLATGDTSEESQFQEYKTREDALDARKQIVKQVKGV